MNRLQKKLLKKIIEILLEANNPLIYVGGGIISANASEELIKLADLLDIPVARSLMGQGAISDLHPLAVGMTGFWGTEFTNSITKEADVILALGTRFSEVDCSSWYEGVTFKIPPTKLIHIDIDPIEIGRNYPVEIGVENYKKYFKKLNRDLEKSEKFPMTPQRIITDIKEIFPEDGIIVTDVGWNKNGVSQQFPITQPGTIIHPGGLATMGFGSAAALGVKLGAPNKKVIALVGDGGFGTQVSVMATAVEYNIPVIWVVMNNYAFGTIAGLEYSHYNTNFGTVFKKDGKQYNPEWADVAKAYGVRSKKIIKVSEFKEVFKKALESSQPYLIDVPMENIPVPTDGVWNINDIYSPKKNVIEGRLL